MKSQQRMKRDRNEFRRWLDVFPWRHGVTFSLAKWKWEEVTLEAEKG